MTWEEKIAYHKERSNQIAQNIIEQIEEGVDKWEMPWHKGIPQAQNRVTGKFYGGKNLLILWDECLEKGYSQNVWATMRQWNQFGSGVQRGSKGTLVKFVIPQNELDDYDQFELEFADEETEDIDGFKIFFHYVFNIDQVTNNRINQIGLFQNQAPKFEQIKEFISKTEAKISHKGTRALYNVVKDQIIMPPKASFREIEGATSLENYYATLLHEVIHWTGHKSRCDRGMINKKGSPAYAFEELIAELGTAILTTQFSNKLSPRKGHAKYVNNWLAVLKHDFKYFIEALELSRTAIHWLFEKTQVLPYPLKDHYSRQVGKDLVKVLNNHMKTDLRDQWFEKVLSFWDELDEVTQDKIQFLVDEDLKRKKHLN